MMGTTFIFVAAALYLASGLYALIAKKLKRMRYLSDETSVIASLVLAVACAYAWKDSPETFLDNVFVVNCLIALGVGILGLFIFMLTHKKLWNTWGSIIAGGILLYTLLNPALKTQDVPIVDSVIETIEKTE